MIIKSKFAVLIIITFVLFAGIWLFTNAANEVNAKSTNMEGCGAKDCKECHTISRQEVEDVFKKLNIQNLKLLDVQMSPVKGLWEVSVEDNGQRGIVYIDFSKDYLVTGSIISVAGKLNVTQQKAEELEKSRRIDVAKIPLADALIMGDKNAAKKVVMFTDPGCPYCIKLHQEMKAIVEKRKDIVFYIKFNPIKKESYEKIKSIVCTKSLKMLADAYENKQIAAAECSKNVDIQKMIDFAKSLGIRSVPTLIMPDGRVHSGYAPADRIIQIIDGG